MGVTPDTETGLPLIGAEQGKQVPIDPKVLQEIRDADDGVVKAREQYKALSYAYLMQTGMVAIAGADAAEKESTYKDVVTRVAALHNVPLPAIKEIDTKKGVFILK